MSFPSSRLLFAAIVAAIYVPSNLVAATIPVTDANVRSGLSPYNWICKADSISSTICGASITVGFRGTRSVSLQVDSAHFTTPVPTRFPILAWSVNGGPLQSHQLAPGENSFVLASGVANPVIDLYIKGMSPFEDRWSGEIPPNSVKITGFAVDDGASTAPVALPQKVWLTIGDSILSGDGAAYAEGQGRPKNDLWASSDDGRASYGYLLARHFGCRESRIAYGGYNWGGGMAKVPAIVTLIDQRSALVSRLDGQMLSPTPAVVFVNLGENGVPRDKDVIAALQKLRQRTGKATLLLVMIPLSGRGRVEITRAFREYEKTTEDEKASLIDLGRITYATADRQHPTAAGHQEIFKLVLPLVEAAFKEKGWR